MDPASARILAAVAAQGVRGAANVIAKVRNSGPQQRAEDLAGRALAPVEHSMTTLLNQLDDRLPASAVTAITSAIQSPDFSEVGRTIAVAIATGELDRSRQAILQITSAILTLQSGLDTESANTASTVLVRALTNLVSTMYADLKENSKAEYGRIIDRAFLEKNGGYLQGILDRASILGRRRPEDLPAIAKYVERYRESAHARTSNIVPASLDNQRFVPIEEIYVEPTLICDDPARFTLPPSTKDVTTLSPLGVVDYGYRVVVLGDPGAGKSTLAQRLTNTISDDSMSKTKATLTPVIVTLRRYEQAKSARSVSLVEYIEAMIREDFHLTAPAGAVEYLLSLGRILVIFDGLDELLDTHRRREVSDSIEAFARLFASTKVLVTSRMVGYWEAPLNPGQFTTVRLSQLSPANIEEYARKWFSLQPALSLQEQSEVAEAFIFESATVPDIRSNPLMLSLLCNIYRGARWIPQNRADLYERCALMLFERWDEQRGIGSQRVLRADARAALQEIAYSIFMSNGSLDPLPERTLKNKLTKFWKEEHFEKLEDAEAAAISLYKSWHGRAWVLTDVGTTSSGERLYRFTHRTFLEYFTAVEIARRNPSPSRLWKVLGPNILEGGWDLVAQIAIQVLHENYRGARRKIYDAIASNLEVAHLSPRQRFNLISFAARHFDALNPPSANCRSLTRNALQFAIAGQPNEPTFPAYEDYVSGAPGEWSGATDIGDPEYHDEDFSDEDVEIGPERSITPLLDLLKIPGHLGQVALDETKAALLDFIHNEDDALSAKAFVFGSCFSQLGSIAASLGISANLRWDSISVEEHTISYLRQNKLTNKRLSAWGKITFWAPIVAARLSLVAPVVAVKAGLSGGVLCSGNPIFHRSTDDRSHETIGVSLLQAYLLQTADHSSAESALAALSRGLRRANFDGDWIGDSNLQESILAPFFYAQESTHSVPDEQNGSNTSATRKNVDAAFSATVLLAALVEHERWNVIDESEDQIAYLRLGPLQSLETVFISRIRPEFYDLAVNALRDFGFDAVQHELLHDWMSNGVDFLERNAFPFRQY